MDKKDKELLFKDICARLPYKLYLKMEVDGKSTNKILMAEWISDIKYHPQYYKPYLRPMSSMARKEFDEYHLFSQFSEPADVIDWLNEHHFDHRGLIEKGLALAAPEGMYE